MTKQSRFVDVYNAHYDDVYSYVVRRVELSAVDDVVATTFLTLWRRLDSLPRESPRPWVYGVARRCVANHLRSSRRQSALVTRLEIASANPHDGELVPDDRTEELLRCFSELSRTDQEVLSLSVWERLSASEAAAVLGCSAVAYRLRLHRARMRLRERLRNLDVWPIEAESDTYAREAS
jgi:RNA polymerase sigma-70 factor (ECF subfamily)